MRRDPIFGGQKSIKAVRKSKRTIAQLDPPDELLSWRIDWREYFRRFAEAHGGNPMEIGGRLVFEDGWSYSASDYRGPEWKPPTGPGELQALLLAYWTARRDEVSRQLRQLRQVKKNLDDLTVLRSLPLTRKVRIGRDDSGVMQWDRQVIDGDELLVRMDWLQADLKNSEEQIKAQAPADARADEKGAVDAIDASSGR